MRTEKNDFGKDRKSRSGGNGRSSGPLCEDHGLEKSGKARHSLYGAEREGGSGNSDRSSRPGLGPNPSGPPFLYLDPRF